MNRRGSKASGNRGGLGSFRAVKVQVRVQLSSRPFCHYSTASHLTRPAEHSRNKAVLSIGRSVTRLSPQQLFSTDPHAHPTLLGPCKHQGNPEEEKTPSQTTEPQTSGPVPVIRRKCRRSPDVCSSSTSMAVQGRCAVQCVLMFHDEA